MCICMSLFVFVGLLTFLPISCHPIRFWCFTCPLAFGCCELSHVIFLKLRKKELLAKVSKFTKGLKKTTYTDRNILELKRSNAVLPEQEMFY